jgi:hypothetical protein
LHVTHAPFAQLCPFGQALPQLPQFFASVFVFVSQPFVSLLPSQSAYPALQVPLHVALPHVRVAMFVDEQESPHAPQLFTSVCGSDSQPSTCLLLLQSQNPASHAPLHVAPWHCTCATWFDEHTMPQPPQFAGSVADDTSQPFVSLLASQFAKPAAHAPVHTPPVHVGAGTLLLEHVSLQAPQFVAEPKMSCSQPFVCLLPSQSANPELHAPVQTPPVQVRAETLFVEQTTPQPPQLPTSVFSATSQPFVWRLPSQSA